MFFFFIFLFIFFFFFFFFFSSRRGHTRFVCDWSSDVCSSDLAALAEQLRGWQRPLTVSTDTPFQLCFRLEEPRDDSDTWQVRFLLQAHDDPSLILPVAEARSEERRVGKESRCVPPKGRLQQRW